MCYNSKGNVFPLQFMIMTVLIYSLKWQVWREMGGGGGGRSISLKFHIEEIKKKKVSEKLNNRKILAYLLCTTLNCL